MCIKKVFPKAKRYKFFKVNLWGRLFILKHFKGRRVMYARVNRRHTLRKVRVNAMKLRRKNHTIKGLGLLAASRIKNFYLSLSNYKLKKYIKKARHIPYYKLKNISLNKPFRVEDKFVSLLESRIENVLHRTGFLSIQAIRQLLSHKKILLNKNTVTRGSVCVKPGDKITFKETSLKTLFFFKFLKHKNVLRKLSKKYRLKRKYPMLQPFLIINKLKHLTMSL